VLATVAEALNEPESLPRPEPVGPEFAHQQLQVINAKLVEWWPSSSASMTTAETCSAW
jgi:hypothetical protein